jgi:hypothetical protein
MIVAPKIRGFICTTAHPVGCAKNVQNQIDYVKANSEIADGPKKVLVIGASTGYGWPVALQRLLDQARRPWVSFLKSLLTVKRQHPPDGIIPARLIKSERRRFVCAQF